VYQEGFLELVRNPIKAKQKSLTNKYRKIKFENHYCTNKKYRLKGLSHEIDFKNFNKGTQLVFKFFRDSNDFKMQKVDFLWLMPFCIGLSMFSCLFLSFPLITSGV
jgi:hypothetical protein